MMKIEDIGRIAIVGAGLMGHGIATPADVDTVVKTGFGRRYAAAGPFEIWELAGWDLVLAVTQYLLPDLASSRDISPLLKEKVKAGQLGVKAGKGFYDWTPASAEALKQRMDQVLTKIAQFSQTD